MQIDPEQFISLVNHSYQAHQHNNLRKAFRQNGQVPFIAHPIWCAVMLLNDPGIPFDIKEVGYQALLLHDTLEDTSLSLPADLDSRVTDLVKQMTHQTWEEEQDISKKTDIVKLLKLYDKAATLYDESIRSDKQRRKEWVVLIQNLLAEVERFYPEARIVTVTRALLNKNNWV